LLALAALIVVFLIADVILTSALDASASDFIESAVMSISLGLCIAHINLISIWAALAPGRLMVRLPWALLLTVIMWAAICLEFNRRNVPVDVHYKAGLILLCAQLAAQSPLWIGAKFWGWRLASRHQRKIGVEATDAQFNIQHMMLGTLILAIVLALFRLVIAGKPVDWSLVRLDPEILVILVGATTTNLLIVVPCIWLAFLPHARIRLALVRWSVVVMLISIFEDIVICTLVGAPLSGIAIFLVTATINLTQCAIVVLTLLKLRRSGFRLVRVGSR
jgi:hypothetical protein